MEVMGCDGFNENIPHRCTCLNTWSSVSGIVWEVIHLVAVSLGEDLRFKRLLPWPVSSMPPVYGSRCELSSHPASLPLLFHHGFESPEMVSPIKSFLL